MKETEKVTTTEKAREAFNQIMIGDHDTANRLLKEVVAETRARRLALRARRIARESAGVQEHPETGEDPS